MCCIGEDEGMVVRSDGKAQRQGKERGVGTAITPHDGRGCSKARWVKSGMHIALLDWSLYLRGAHNSSRL